MQRDPVREAMIQLVDLMRIERAVEVSLLYSSVDTKEHFTRRLKEVRLQIAALKGATCDA